MIVFVVVVLLGATLATMEQDYLKPKRGLGAVGISPYGLPAAPYYQAQPVYPAFAPAPAIYARPDVAAYPAYAAAPVPPAPMYTTAYIPGVAKPPLGYNIYG